MAVSRRKWLCRVFAAAFVLLPCGSVGVWPSVSSKLAQAENVRAALLLVSRGEAPAGIVYQTDAMSDSNVKIIARSRRMRILQSFTANATHPDAATFLAYIRSDKAKPTFEAQGSSVLGSGRS